MVELAVHLLDLDVDVEPVGSSFARLTIEALADAQLPRHRGDADAVLAGLGRIPWPSGAGDPGPFPVSL